MFYINTSLFTCQQLFCFNFLNCLLYWNISSRCSPNQCDIHVYVSNIILHPHRSKPLLFLGFLSSCLASTILILSLVLTYVNTFFEIFLKIATFSYFYLFFKVFLHISLLNHQQKIKFAITCFQNFLFFLHKSHITILI